MPKLYNLKSNVCKNFITIIAYLCLPSIVKIQKVTLRGAGGPEPETVTCVETGTNRFEFGRGVSFLLSWHGCTSRAALRPADL